jgi:arsenite-transporting ATPase
VICNRVFPEKADDYFAGWLKAQEHYLEMIEESFAPLPILKIPYFEQEVIGLEALHQMAWALFGDDNPARLYYPGQAYTITQQEAGYILKVPLPFATREEISVLRNGEELIIEVGSRRRNFILPRALRELKIGSASFHDQALNIHFEDHLEEVNHA